MVVLTLLACGVGEGTLGVNEVSTAWVEVYNAEDADRTLDGWSLQLEDTRWDVPLGISVPAGGVAMLDLDEDGTGVVGGVQIPAGPSVLRVFDADGAEVQTIMVPDLGDDRSFGRLPDGAANWQVLDTPSPGTLNRP